MDAARQRQQQRTVLAIQDAAHDDLVMGMTGGFRD